MNICGKNVYMYMYCMRTYRYIAVFFAITSESGWMEDYSDLAIDPNLTNDLSGL